MTSYEFTIYELHYYVEYTHKHSDDSIEVHTGDERVQYFTNMDDLMDKLDELKKRYDGHVAPSRYGTTFKKLSKASYITTRNVKQTFGIV